MNLYDADTSLLDQLALPEKINREDFIGRLMLDIGEQEVYITNPKIMKIGIGVWSRGRLPIWEKLAAVQDLEYNPIWNVDGTVTHEGSDSDSRTYGRERSEDITRDTDTETIGQISADNSESWSNDTKTNTEEDETIGTEETIADTENRSGSDTWTETRTGNIGVTTTQKMLNEEVEFWGSYDIINYIIHDFAKEFCLLVF